ncbi:XRE family transcriptional regulator [Brevibacillus laterosporus]|nr:helix-turn-helix transcriptional regulator [Brevibacillus laterosporus]PPA85911.1 XRE family transcriptional regulator [Brevibacillus laterosporus]
MKGLSDTVLKRKRLEKGYTVEAMAQLLGIPAGYYSQIENGQRGLSVERGMQIAKILGVEVEEIFLTSRYAIRKVSHKTA